MKVAVVTLFPEMFSALTEHGVTRRAIADDLMSLQFFNPRAFTSDKHQTVDDRPYGGGPGMVMRVEPLALAVDASLSWLNCERHEAQIVYLSPQGRALNTKAVNDFVQYRHLVLICGRYEGIDERFIASYVDQEWSIGDYVLSGGELPAMVMLDAMIRKIPGALGAQASSEQDSFEDGLLDYPHFTRPELYSGQCVPGELLSGDHEKIRLWRRKQALGRTLIRRPDLIEKLDLSSEDLTLLEQFKQQNNF